MSSYFVFGEQQDAAEFMVGFVKLLSRAREGDPDLAFIFRQQVRIVRKYQSCHQTQGDDPHETIVLRVSISGATTLKE